MDLHIMPGEFISNKIRLLGKILRYVGTKKPLMYTLVAGVYLLSTAYYMGPAFTHCTDHIYGFGDSTAGPIWRESLKPEQPLLGGYETATNYPYGESLYSPVGIVSLVQTTVIGTMSELVGPVCSYNLYNIAGYLITSMLMFGFVSYLTKSRWIALLAGYMVAFTPYVQSKVGGHPSYGYVGLLIAILWLFLHIIRYRKLIHGIALGVLVAVCAYFDPYFILLAGTLITAVAMAWLLVRPKRIKKLLVDQRSRWKATLWTLKPFLVAFLVFLVLVSPLAFIRITEGEKITNSVSGVRGNVVAAAMLCSNKPIDYLLPDPNNVHLVKLFGQEYTLHNISQRNWCGYGESRVSISLTALMVLFITTAILLWEKLSGRRMAKSLLSHYDDRLVIGSVLSIGLLAFIIGLPPYIHGIITPSGAILKVTETWRIFAREYLLVNVAVTLLLSLALKYFSISKAFKQRRLLKFLILLVILFGVVLEYQINNPFSPPTFSYSRDIPSVYYQVRDSTDINAIAEYPIDRTGVEYDSIVYYTTMQVVHKKSILNSTAMVDSKEELHVSLKDLTDPQTFKALRALGIRYVVIHGEKIEDIMNRLPDIQIIGQDNPVVYGLTMVRSDDTNQIVLARIPEGPKATNVLVISRGYTVNLPLTHSPIGGEFEVLENAQLRVDSLQAEESRSLQCFDVKMASPNDVAKLKISVNDSVKQELVITSRYTHIEVIAGPGDTVTLNNENGYNMRLNNLGCR